MLSASPGVATGAASSINPAAGCIWNPQTQAQAKPRHGTGQAAPGTAHTYVRNGAYTRSITVLVFAARRKGQPRTDSAAGGTCAVQQPRTTERRSLCNPSRTNGNGGVATAKKNAGLRTFAVSQTHDGARHRLPLVHDATRGVFEDSQWVRCVVSVFRGACVCRVPRVSWCRGVVVSWWVQYGRHTAAVHLCRCSCKCRCRCEGCG